MPTSARGISDSGQVVGSVSFGPGASKGFVTTLAGLPYEAITIPGSALLVYPGADQTVPEGITNAGTIVGVWTTPAGDVHGFIASPSGKK